MFFLGLYYAGGRDLISLFKVFQCLSPFQTLDLLSLPAVYFPGSSWDWIFSWQVLVSGLGQKNDVIHQAML